MTKKNMLCRICASLLSVCILAVSLTSCGDRWNSLLSQMGFETHDYESEKTVRVLENDGESALEFSEYLMMLTMTSPYLPEIENARDAVTNCRDSLLNYMLTDNYSRYTGNLQLLDEAQEAYPHMKIMNLIPAEEFEKTFYKFFGGSVKLTRKSGEYFVYLDKVGAYTSVSEPQTKDISVEVTEIYRTKNTYRMKARLTLGENTSPEYDIMLIRREDSSVYFAKVREAAR